MKTYFAILHKDPESAVGVSFPDLPGCFSAGDDFGEAVRNAQEAIQLYAEVEMEFGRRIPEPRTLDALYADPEVREDATGGVFVGIPFDGTIAPQSHSAVEPQGVGSGFSETGNAPYLPEQGSEHDRKR